MTYQPLRARVVLDDCRIAANELRNTIDPQRFRLYWAACCALLRAVGHVLEKVDAEEQSKYEPFIRAAWKKWKTDRAHHSIFWDFIEAERNLVLKEYETRFFMGGVQATIFYDNDHATTEHLGPDYFIPITDGPFEGEDARDVVDQALEWWNAELLAIEDSVI